jgi:uncharacterized membrane protein YgaE (UPF0421/DUF939 family)
MAAIVVTQGNYKDSVQSGIARAVATVVGCLIAIIIILINAENQYIHILLIGLGCALNIYFCVLIKQPEAAALASIVFLSMAVQPPDNTLLFSIMRFAETMTGIVISIAVNVLLKNPRKSLDSAACYSVPDTESSMLDKIKSK